MKKSTVWRVAVFILVLGAGAVFGQSEEANRHFNYGVAALQTKDYEAAIRELEQAVRLAPNWPEAFYNLGLAQQGAKKYGDAVKSYREYFRLAPNASDAEEVKGLIAKMESRAEKGEGIDKVHKMMMSDQFERKQISQIKLSGQAELALGFGYPDGGPLFRRFRMESGQMQASNDWHTNQYADAVRYSDDPLPRPRDWEPVEVNGRFYEYTFSDYMAKNNGYILRGDYEVKGEIISIDPPQVKEIETCSISWGVPFTEKAPPWKSAWVYSGAMEFIWEYVAKSAGVRDPALDARLLKAADDGIKGNKEESERLIAGSAGVNAGEKEDVKPAVISNEQELNNEGLFKAVLPFGGSKEDVDRWIAAGADVNAKNEYSASPLHLIAQFGYLRGQKDKADLLIARGADVNIKNIVGETPLFIAVEYGSDARQMEMIELLIARGADVNAKNNFNWSILGQAESRGFKEIAALLRKHGAR